MLTALPVIEFREEKRNAEKRKSSRWQRSDANDTLWFIELSALSLAYYLKNQTRVI